MVKSLSAPAILLLLGATVVALPGFAPSVEARESAVLAEADRLSAQTAAIDCSTQVWPDFAASCLRNTSAGVKIHEARLVTVLR
jgi:hypothetical protein